MVHVEGFLAVQKGVSFLQNTYSQIVKSPILESITDAANDAGIGRQVFHDFVELPFGLVGLALQSVDINEVGNGLVISRVFLRHRLEFFLSPVVVLQINQTFDKLLEITRLSRFFIEFRVKVTGFFVVLLAVIL